MLIALVSILVIGAADGEVPQWSSAELKGFFARIQAVQNAPTDQYTNEAAKVGGLAYRVRPENGEDADTFSRRVLKKRDPKHPNVKKNQWTLALMSVFYGDVSKRADTLSRFEKNRNERQYLDRLAKDTKVVSEDFAKVITLEGVGGKGALPEVAKCDDLTTWGAEVEARTGAISMRGFDRAKFEGDAPAADVARTTMGAVREIFMVFDQFNKEQGLLAAYDSSGAKNRGHIRVSIPASLSSTYFNEIVKGGIEAGMHTAHVIVRGKDDKPCEIVVPIKERAKKTKKKPKKPDEEPEPVKCKNGVPMQKCVDRIIEAKTSGSILFIAE